MMGAFQFSEPEGSRMMGAFQFSNPPGFVMTHEMKSTRTGRTGKIIPMAKPGTPLETIIRRMWKKALYRGKPKFVILSPWSGGEIGIGWLEVNPFEDRPAGTSFVFHP